MFKFCSKKLRSYLEIMYSITLAITCVYNCINSSTYVCSLITCNGELVTYVNSMFPRIIAVACFVSKISNMVNNLANLSKYNHKINEYNLHFPINISQKSSRRIFIMFIGFAYVSIILPINIVRLYLFHYNKYRIEILIFFATMYVQNWSICLIEIGFIVRCFGLFQKFQIINEELVVLKTETISKNKYPIVLQNKVQSDVTNSPQFQTLANTIELLRMKHQFVRGALRDLNKLYGTQLGSSLVFLFILILFDIY